MSATSPCEARLNSDDDPIELGLHKMRRDAVEFPLIQDSLYVAADYVVMGEMLLLTWVINVICCAIDASETVGVTCNCNGRYLQLVCLLRSRLLAEIKLSLIAAELNKIAAMVMLLFCFREGCFQLCVDHHDGKRVSCHFNLKGKSSEQVR